MKDKVRYVGMDVHKLTIAMAVADEGGGEPELLAKIPNGALRHHIPELVARSTG